MNFVVVNNMHAMNQMNIIMTPLYFTSVLIWPNLQKTKENFVNTWYFVGVDF